MFIRLVGSILESRISPKLIKLRTTTTLKHEPVTVMNRINPRSKQLELRMECDLVPSNETL
jgi:hypothetical protein